ncbi:MAG TPA: LLM class flavin-dependent oxidoreductase [Thermomicrobiales bacterium]|nr:LLM class flavin-dependent oxidoreductase [Thermomicrobiales bacterium]
MPTYGHNLIFGTFTTPTAQPPHQAVELAIIADKAGLDLVTFQDHPYNAGFHDTWTLISYAASRTENVHLAGNVLNLPLRNPAVLARSAASLDLLSGGRVEMGIGAGAFWQGIEAMGGDRLTPGESIQALEEGIEIMRQIWNPDEKRGARVDGEFHKVNGARRGPKPAHDIGIWIGAYKPRILRMTGRAADGWLPSLGYLEGGPAALAEMNKYIDDGAEKAGREPSAIRRMLNINGQFAQQSGGFLVGPPQQWAQQIAEVATEYGISGFILAADDPYSIEMYASEVAPAVREIVGEAIVSR